MGARAAGPRFCCREAAMNTTGSNYKHLDAAAAAAAVLAVGVGIG
jgi:hypothetical protein